MTSLRAIHHSLPLLQSMYSSNTPPSSSSLPSLLFSKEKTLNDYYDLFLYLKSLFPSIENIQTLQCLSLSLKFMSLPSLTPLFKYGDKRSSLYFIIEGKCALLLPQEENLKMTEEEYILYLTKLFAYDEMFLLEMTIRSNRGLFDVHSHYHFEKIIEEYLFKYTKNANDNDDIAILPYEEIKNLYKVNNKNFIYAFVSWLTFAYESQNCKKSVIPSIEEYQKRIEPVMISYETEDEEDRANKYIKKNASIYKYINQRTLSKGARINESFTQSSSRSSTIIAESQMVVGYLTKDFFILSPIKNFFMLGKSGNSSIINSHPIFSSTNHVFFDKKYMQYFEFCISDKGTVLLSEGSKVQCSYVYFIKKGTYEITYKTKKIGYVERNEVIGCDDYIDSGKFKFTVRMVDKGEYFAIKYKDMKKICEDDEEVKRKYSEYVEMKREFFDRKIEMIERNKGTMRMIKFPLILPKGKSLSPGNKRMNVTICRQFNIEQKNEKNENISSNRKESSKTLNKSIIINPEIKKQITKNSKFKFETPKKKITLIKIPFIYKKTSPTINDDTFISNEASTTSSQKNIFILKTEKNIPIIDISKLTIENVCPSSLRINRYHSPPCLKKRRLFI